ncbi:MAG TPA: M48 family metallopeptidase [Chitinophaga sp.]|uniref:M48 family metallopeptidase n=1 Tax=Chitinophaga sp. TaxID=1869181 RepID=UPI002DBEAB72|nr:M48 family metallopeptidase [Chitinophaga sp.]HEU4553298.1 M48 family metallopeptidase [Chitinophaga sp.]
MQTYIGKYYNGQTNSSTDAAITLAPKQIIIEIKDAQGTLRQLYWFWDQVKHPAPDTLEYPGYPLQRITVASLTFADAVQYYLQHKKGQRFFARRGRTIAGMVFLAVVGIIALVYFWFIPFVAARIANNLPVSYEERLGQSSYDALMQQYHADTAASRQVNAFFRQLQIPSRYTVQITVVRGKEANAFALPGGHIIVYDQLLKEMRHYEELAALLSHEYAHVALKHTTKTIFRSMGTYVFMSLLFGDMSGAGAVIAENANSLKSLHYSRRLEKQADLYGLELLQARQIDPRGFEWLFNTLKQQGGMQPSEWLSSHPDLDNRIRYIHEHTMTERAVTDSSLYRIFITLKQ